MVRLFPINKINSTKLLDFVKQRFIGSCGRNGLSQVWQVEWAGISLPREEFDRFAKAGLARKEVAGG